MSLRSTRRGRPPSPRAAASSSPFPSRSSGGTQARPRARYRLGSSGNGADNETPMARARDSSPATWAGEPVARIQSSPNRSGVVKQPQAAGPAQGSDATADILSGLGAEARQRRQTAIARRGLEIGQRRDRERVVDLAHLGGAQAGNAEHLRKARRDLLAQLVECARAARGKQLRSGGVLRGPDAKRALPLELEKRGELVEGAANGLFVHACPMNLTAQL